MTIRTLTALLVSLLVPLLAGHPAAAASPAAGPPQGARAAGIAGPAVADAALARIRAAGELRCAGVLRPGLSFPAADGSWHGLDVALCRAVASAVLGPQARIAFRSLYAPSSWQALRDGAVDLAFLTPEEIAEQGLSATVLPVLPVFWEEERILVPGASPVRHAADLAGRHLCFEPGTVADRDVDALIAPEGGEPAAPQHDGVHGVAALRGPFFEAEEMIDAFNVGRCDAIAGEATALAALRLNVDAGRGPGRLLPDVLSVRPVLAATMADASSRWPLLVDWVLQTVIAGPPAPGSSVPPILQAGLGLDAGWQARVLAATGGYDALRRAELGDLSPLALPAGANAGFAAGGLIDAPLAR